jgi:hypothetical protein
LALVFSSHPDKGVRADDSLVDELSHERVLKLCIRKKQPALLARAGSKMSQKNV